MQNDYKDTIKGYCYIITNNREVVECTEVKRTTGFVTLKFCNGDSIRLRESRTFRPKIEVKEYLRELKEKLIVIKFSS